MIRLIKCALALFLGLFCMTYALQNVFNLSSAYGFVVADDQHGRAHVAYPNSVGPAVTAPGSWSGRYCGSSFSASSRPAPRPSRAFMDMWSARNADAAVFNPSKKWAITGAGIGIDYLVRLLPRHRRRLLPDVADRGWQRYHSVTLACSSLMCGVLAIWLSMEDD